MDALKGKEFRTTAEFEREFLPKAYERRVRRMAVEKSKPMAGFASLSDRLLIAAKEPKSSDE